MEECLSSLSVQTEKVDKVLVIENDSDDCSAEIVSRFQNAKLYQLDENTGYAAALNIGIRQCLTDLIVTANPDTKFDRHFSENIKNRFEKEKDLDIASPLLLRFEGDLVDSAGQSLSIACHPVEIGFGKKMGNVDIEEKEIFSVCGAVTVFRRTSLEKLKIQGEYYDESFFMFWEDLDIGWRADLFGLKKKLCPEIIAYHFRGGTMKHSFISRFSMALGRSGEIKYHLVKNRYLTLIKNFRFKSDWFKIPFIFFKDIVWIGLLTLSSPKIIIRFWKSAKLLGGAWAKRKIIKKNE